MALEAPSRLVGLLAVVEKRERSKARPWTPRWIPVPCSLLRCPDSALPCPLPGRSLGPCPMSHAALSALLQCSDVLVPNGVACCPRLVAAGKARVGGPWGILRRPYPRNCYNQKPARPVSARVYPHLLLLQNRQFTTSLQGPAPSPFCPTQHSRHCPSPRNASLCISSVRSCPPRLDATVYLLPHTHPTRPSTVDGKHPASLHLSTALSPEPLQPLNTLIVRHFCFSYHASSLILVLLALVDPPTRDRPCLIFFYVPTQPQTYPLPPTRNCSCPSCTESLH